MNQKVNDLLLAGVVTLALPSIILVALVWGLVKGIAWVAGYTYGAYRVTFYGDHYE